MPVTLACLAAGAMPARAGLIKCDSHTMVEADFVAMKHAVTKASAPHVLDWRSVVPCMNPGRGRVWIDARPEPQPDGSRFQITMECLRGKSPWKCAVIHRRYEFSLSLTGSERQFALLIPAGMAFEQVRSLVIQAFEKGSTLTLHDYCDRTTQQPDSKEDAESERALADVMASRRTPYEGWISDEAGNLTLGIENGGIWFEFAPTPDAAGNRAIKCWSEFITVS